MKSAKEQDSRFPLATPSSVNDDAANQRKESDPKVNWWEQKKPSTYYYRMAIPVILILDPTGWSPPSRMLRHRGEPTNRERAIVTCGANRTRSE